MLLWVGNHGDYVELPDVRTDPAADPSTDYEVWVTGQFDATGTRLLLEPDRVAGSLALVVGLDKDGGHDPTTTALRMTDGPADVNLLGWVGQNHALAILDQNFDDQTAHLVLLTLDAEAGDAEGTVVGDVTVTGDDADLSFATDLASVKTPTRDFPADSVNAGDDAGEQSAPGGTASWPGCPPPPWWESAPRRWPSPEPSPWPSGGGAPEHARTEGRVHEKARKTRRRPLRTVRALARFPCRGVALRCDGVHVNLALRG